MKPRSTTAFLLVAFLVLGWAVAVDTASATGSPAQRSDSMKPTTVAVSNTGGCLNSTNVNWFNQPVAVTLSIADPLGVLAFDGGSNCIGHPPQDSQDSPDLFSYAFWTDVGVTTADNEDYSLPSNVIRGHSYYNLAWSGKTYSQMIEQWSSGGGQPLNPSACYNVLCVQGTLNPFATEDAAHVWTDLYNFVAARRQEGWTVYVQTCNPDPQAGVNAKGASVLSGNGDGSLQPKTDYATGAGPSSVAVGDVNGDGTQDLVTANSGLITDFRPPHAVSSVVSVLLGNSDASHPQGNGTFQPQTGAATGLSPSSVAVGDFNGDGKLDLATANSAADTVSVLLANGDGSFGAKTDYATGLSPSSVAVGDFNGDQKLDLAVVNAGDDAVDPFGYNTVSVLLGKGDGTFQPKTDVDAGFASQPHSITVGDFNGDGKLDLVTANSGSNSVGVLFGDGSGGFPVYNEYLTGADPRSVAVGYFNADTNLDVAVANAGSNTVSVLFGQGGGSLGAKTDFTTGKQPCSIIAADLNGDSHQDLVTANYGDDTVSVLSGNGDGSFQPKTDYASGENPCSVAVGDFNGDGKLDLVTTNYHDAVNNATYAEVEKFNTYLTDGYTFNGSVIKYAGADGLVDSSQDTRIGQGALGYWNSLYWQADHLHFTPDGAKLLANLYMNPAIKSAVSPIATWATTWYQVDGGALMPCSLGQFRSPSTDPAYPFGNPLNDPTVTLNGSGAHTIRCYSVDGAGNTEQTKTYTVKFDLKPPSAISGLKSSTHPVQTTWYASSSPAFSWSPASDSLSGLAGYSYVLDQTPTTVSDNKVESSGTTASFPGRPDGTWYFHVCAVDKAGNAGATSNYTVHIDTTAPVTTDNYDGQVHSQVTVNLSATDVGGSGVAFTQYRVDGGAWQTGTAVTLTAIHTKHSGAPVSHLIEYRSTDKAGNVEQIESCTVYLGF